MYIDDLVVRSVKAEISHLKRMIDQIEVDMQWRENSEYYAKEIRNVEKSLRKVRKAEFEPMSIWV